jgi:hypothetical protein
MHQRQRDFDKVTMGKLTETALPARAYAEESSESADNTNWRLHGRPFADFRTARHELRQVPLSREVHTTLPGDIGLLRQHLTMF